MWRKESNENSYNIVTLQLIIITNNKMRISLIFYVSQATNIKWQAEAMAYLRACVVSWMQKPQEGANREGERERTSGRQQQEQTIKRSLWQSNKKKRAMRIGKQIKTFRREQQLQDAHTCDPWGQEIHIACTKGATAKAKEVPYRPYSG